MEIKEYTDTIWQAKVFNCGRLVDVWTKFHSITMHDIGNLLVGVKETWVSENNMFETKEVWGIRSESHMWFSPCDAEKQSDFPQYTGLHAWDSVGRGLRQRMIDESGRMGQILNLGVQLFTSVGHSF